MSKITNKLKLIYKIAQNTINLISGALFCTFLICFFINLFINFIIKKIPWHIFFSDKLITNTHNFYYIIFWILTTCILPIIFIILFKLAKSKIQKWASEIIFKNLNNNSLINYRCGFGYDVHRLANNTDLILCGTKIKYKKGLTSFSDGDVATHALIDSLLGAAAQFDIGTHFPDNNSNYKNVSSIILLKKTNDLLKLNHFKIGNIDLTIVAQAPILKPFIPQMKANLSKTLTLNQEQINIKATTEEHLGFTGQQLGISAFCATLIYKI